MKTLQLMRYLFALMGFSSSKSLWNREFLIGYTTAALTIPSFLMFLFRVADSTQEFIDSIYITAVAIAISVAFLNTVYKRSKLIVLFDEIEENVNNSEYAKNKMRSVN